MGVKNPVARDVVSPKYRMRVVPNKGRGRGSYQRKERTERDSRSNMGFNGKGETLYVLSLLLFLGGIMGRFSVFLMGLLFSVFAFAGEFSEVCPKFFVGGVQPSVSVMTNGSFVELCNKEFATLYSTESKSPVFSVEVITPESVSCAAGKVRVNKFAPDSRLVERAELSDFKGSSIYDRGHLVPLGDMCSNVARAESFLLSNMGAQYFSLNRGEWARIESEVRAGVVSTGLTAHVYTGLHYKDGFEGAIRLGKGVRVPSHYWKLVYFEATGKVKIYWRENCDPSLALDSRDDMTYSELVRITGVHILPDRVIP